MRDDDFTDAEFEIVRPPRSNPPVSREEFLSWSWPLRILWLVLVSASVMGGIALSRWMFPTLMRLFGA